MRSCVVRALLVAGMLLAARSASPKDGPRIKVELPPDRARCGRLTLLDARGRIAAGPFRACGVADQLTAAAHGNPTRSPLGLYGDTPTGGYRVVHVFKVGDGTSYRAPSYGDYAAIRLEPVSDDAKVAATVGRTGLLIHGGASGKNGRLRPTNGCIRLSNADIRVLVDQLFVLAVTQGPPEACTVAVSPSVEVSEPDASTRYDEGDPPPGNGADVVLP